MVLNIVVLLFGFILLPKIFYAQEIIPEFNVEESAAVFLEEYSDEFQETFFEALKEKGIENYDKAINLLLKCKQLQSENIVIDHELAKAYMASRQHTSGQEYAIVAVNGEPTNLWYLNTLVEIVQNQGNSIEGIKSQLPFSHNKLQENLALIYFKQKKYEKALEVLETFSTSAFSKELKSKIKDSIVKKEKYIRQVEVTDVNSENTDPTQSYRDQIESLIRINDIQQLLTVSEESLERFPLQPYFYYAYGYALNKNGKHSEAIEILETGVDYLLNDVSLANKIYTQLANAYTALNNSVKANMYLSKVKQGF